MNSNKSLSRADTFCKGTLLRKRTGKMEMMLRVTENSHI